ncbi:ATP-binding protein [Candidatus Bathyarchaeota archaeon]|nr:ATP-binding protein [Candidatus Bathyarchaeota archaeon]
MVEIEKYMKMRKKVLIIVAVLMIAIFVVLHAIVNVVFLQSFITLEKQKTDESVTRTTNALSNELAEISSRVSDWAFWDDTYAFVQDKNEDYIILNLGDSTFANLRLNLMLVINNTGQIVYGEAFDLNNNTEMAMPQGISEEIASKPDLWNHTTKDSIMEGLILLPQEPLVFSSKPILTSQEEGPIMGALIMGRYIDSREIAYLSNMVRSPLAVSRYNDPQIQNDFQIARSSLSSTAPIFVEPLNADTVGGYALINDVYSKPGLILRIDLPRDIYKQGLTTVNNFIALVAALCAVFGAAMIILLEKGMLSSLSKLTRTVKEMGTREYSTHANSRFDTDETAILADAIKDAISQRLRAIEELAGMVGHDLRNPLTGIKGAAYYIRTKYESKMDAKGKEMLKIIEDDVAYSNKIVNDLLEYSGKIQLEYVDTTPEMLMKDALTLVNIPKNIELMDLTENETEITVDADKMKRVFVNLIKNGVDAMPEGGSLTIKSTKVSDGVQFTFSDTGSGMSKETLNRICTPLFTTKARGMGFGLPISKRQVEAHGGSLSFESTTGKGTTATVFIPTKAKAETKDYIWADLPALGVQSTSEHPSPLS